MLRIFSHARTVYALAFNSSICFSSQPQETFLDLWKKSHEIRFPLHDFVSSFLVFKTKGNSFEIPLFHNRNKIIRINTLARNEMHLRTGWPRIRFCKPLFLNL